MDSGEIFAAVRIDEPVQSDTSAAWEARAVPASDVSVLCQPLMSPEVADSERARLAPEPGAAYRMVSVADMLGVMGLSNDGDGYLDDATQMLMQSRLHRMGLALATEIVGALRLRCSDEVPVVEMSTSRPSRYSTVTVCLYLIAWMLEGNGASERDLSIVDAWLADYDPKAGWAGASQGTLRWLLSRKLILTAKRKQRLGRIKRYPKVRQRLVDVLLRLVSDPSTATPKRMERLQTIYRALDLDAASIHGDIHRLTTAPTTARGGAKGLDSAALRRMADNTRQAQAMLSQVFSDDDDERPEETAAEKVEVQITRRLSEREQWTEAEAAALAREYGMSLGAMLERVNDLAYDQAGEALAEQDGDVIWVDNSVARTLQG